MPCFNSIQNLTPSKKAVLWTCINFSLLTLLFVLVFEVILEKGVWSNYESRPCENYCENSHVCDHELEDRPVVQQPVNAYSNLAYLLVGLWPLMNRLDAGTLSFFGANAYLCVGSFVFHASLTVFWMNMDVAGMLTVMTAIVGHGVHSVTGLSWNYLCVAVIVVGVTVMLKKDEMYEAGGSSGKWFLATIIAIFVLDLILVIARARRIIRDMDHRRNRKEKALETGKVILSASLPGFLFPLAVVIRANDSNKEWCNPDSIVQGHGAWHILSAVAIHFVWWFYDSNQLADLLAKPQQREQKEGGLDVVESEREGSLNNYETPTIDEMVRGEEGTA